MNEAIEGQVITREIYELVSYDPLVEHARKTITSFETLEEKGKRYQRIN